MLHAVSDKQLRLATENFCFHMPGYVLTRRKLLSNGHIRASESLDGSTSIRYSHLYQCNEYTARLYDTGCASEAL